MKFAYLIMAHHRFDVLKVLLEDLDDSRNDIFLHIDRKAADYDKDELRKAIRYANIVFVDPISVYWGHYSQIQCVINLLKSATDFGNHDYYHLLVGVEFPIKSQDEIHSFFLRNKGSEFIGYDMSGNKFYDRIQYWYPFGKYARSRNRWQKFLYKKCLSLLEIQQKIGVDRKRGRCDYYKKGYANWSITDDLAHYILKNEKQIKKDYRWTKCADEIFIHTLVFHSKFYECVFDKEDEYCSAMRLTTWEDENNRFYKKDIPYILNSGKLFARKFDSDDAVEIIREIQRLRE